MGLFRYIKNQIRHDRNIKHRLDVYSSYLSTLCQEVKQESIRRIKDSLTEMTLTCHKMGVSEELLNGEEIIVSLTTFGRRIKDVYLAIESIMQGTIKPNRIILWLSEDEFKDKQLPQTLVLQQKRGLQIEYCEDIRSYKKIVPTMLKYPCACVVTIDDDLIYDFDLLENLYEAHQNNPKTVCACRIHRMTLDEHKKPKSYMQWQWSVWPQDISNLNFLTSGGGTLFPPNCFIEEFFNKDAFMSLCPYADDIWINAMIWLSGRTISKAFTHSLKGSDFIPSFIEQDIALSDDNTNNLNCRNDLQIKAVMDKYDLYHYLQ